MNPIALTNNDESKDEKKNKTQAVLFKEIQQKKVSDGNLTIKDTSSLIHLNELIDKANSDDQLTRYSTLLQEEYFFDSPIPGVGWYAPEWREHDQKPFRWMGSSSSATFSLITGLKSKITFIIEFIHITDPILSSLRLFMNGELIFGEIVNKKDGTITVKYSYSPKNPIHYFSIKFESFRRFNPEKGDNRTLSIAVSKIKIIE